MGLKRKKNPSSEKVFCQLLCQLPPALLAANESTHKLPALEQVAVVGVCRRVLGHETEDFWSERQHGGVGDGGERAGVEQELRDQEEEEVRT